jgi:hypothetical protein
LVAHRAIQLSYTHAQDTVDALVRAAVDGCIRDDEKFATYFTEADLAAQSDLIVSATSRVMGFLDSWPVLHPSWAPRFEEPLQAKVGRLTLSGRADLVLDRPQGDGKQTMLIVDWKSTALNDTHLDEAGFYALLATLRFGVPPYRSTVYSLTSGEWTEPDVTPDLLHAAAQRVIVGVNALVETMTETRAPTQQAGPWCSWCQLRDACATYALVEHTQQPLPRGTTPSAI